mmetsp:Transcript_23888/g.27741  ORF Transcript_23888/g.27741 Transcript_23888/m.27741 type:complete len:212 (-) Transcript_23888:13-648(-)
MNSLVFSWLWFLYLHFFNLLWQDFFHRLFRILYQFFHSLDNIREFLLKGLSNHVLHSFSLLHDSAFQQSSSIAKSALSVVVAITRNIAVFNISSPASSAPFHFSLLVALIECLADLIANSRVFNHCLHKRPVGRFWSLCLRNLFFFLSWRDNFSLFLFSGLQTRVFQLIQDVLSNKRGVIGLVSFNEVDLKSSAAVGNLRLKSKLVIFIAS